MKKKTLALIIFLCFVGILIISAVICVIIANSKNDKSTPDGSLASWQYSIKNDTLLKNTVIPGAHDAGTVGLPYFTSTQSRSVAELLLCGTRYFDLRVSYADGKLRIFHGPSKGALLDGIINDFKIFLQAHPSEI